jgi:hypothetical protein
MEEFENLKMKVIENLRSYIYVNDLKKNNQQAQKIARNQSL